MTVLGGSVPQTRYDNDAASNTVLAVLAARTRRLPEPRRREPQPEAVPPPPFQSDSTFLDLQCLDRRYEELTDASEEILSERVLVKGDVGIRNSEDDPRLASSATLRTRTVPTLRQTAKLL